MLIGCVNLLNVIYPAGGLQAATVLTGGVAILGTAALLAALAAGRSGGGRRRHGKRSIEEKHNLDLELAVLSQIEPEQCFRRLVCDLATGRMPPSQNDLIASLFDDVEGIDVTSALFEYTVATKLGRVTKDITSCELRYRCPFSGTQILETAARR